MTESMEHGTSAKVERMTYDSYQETVMKKNDSLRIPFDVSQI
jgi:hypothetical protein